MRFRHYTYPLGSNLAVVSPLRDSLMILNPTARLIWEMFAQGDSTDEVVNKLSSHFNVPQETAWDDVSAIRRLWDSDIFPVCPQNGNISTNQSAQIDPLLDDLNGDIQPVSEHVYALSEVSFRIRFHSAEIESIIQSVIGHLEKDSNLDVSHTFEVMIEGSDYVLQRDGVEVGRKNAPHSLRHDLVFEIAKISYPDQEWLIFMHAGAVGTGERCLVLPGLPKCGKSTLTAALILEGFAYIGEDIVPLSRRTCCAVPVPTRICLREEGWLVLKREYPQAQALPGGCRDGRQLRYLTPPGITLLPPRKLPVHCLLFPEYAAGQALQISTLSSEDKLARLIQTGAWFDNSLDENAIAELLEYIQRTPGYLLRYGNFHDAVNTVKDLLSQ